MKFTDIDSVNNSSSTTNYQYTDSLTKGTNYYRLKIIDSIGNYQYSQIRSVVKDDNVTSITIFPNPVTARILYVKTPTNCQSIQLLDLLGRIVATETISGIDNTLKIPNVATGVYFVIVQTDTEKKVVKIFVN